MNLPECVREEILAMERRDLEETERLAKEGELEKCGYHPFLQKLHGENRKRLCEITERYGLPTTQSAGEAAARAAWRIVQHSIGAPDFMRRCLRLYEESGDDVPLRFCAYLGDRIAFYERRPQVYGTQFDYDLNGKMSVWWLKDENAVDERRARAGLCPLREAETRFGEYPKISEKEALIKRREQEAWLTETGWCTAEDIKNYYAARGKI